jgi:hypothetical protein
MKQGGGPACKIDAPAAAHLFPKRNHKGLQLGQVSFRAHQLKADNSWLISLAKTGPSAARCQRPRNKAQNQKQEVESSPVK